MKTISVRGTDRLALVDDEDYERIMQYKWRLHSNGYVCASECRALGHTTILMHRLVLRASGGEIDHIDHDKFNNQKSNLRFCTHSQNHANMMGFRSTGFKGVSWSKTHGLWQSQITVQGKNHHLGFFGAPEEAARVYDEKAREFFGEFARTNFAH